MKKINSLIIIFLVFFYNSLFCSNKDETVVLVHGLLGSSWNMFFLKKNLYKIGCKTTSWKYDSRDKVIEEHGKDLVDYLKILAKENPDQKINYVAHSLGGLILRSALNNPECPAEAKTGKIVLLATPNKGTIWARYLNKYSLVKKYLKDFSAKELMTKYNFDYLGDFPQNMEVLVIAGSFGFNPIIPKENDGTVAVEETFLNTPHKHLVIKTGHKSILFSKKVCSETINFLK
jgi:triacylglycerol esterase/lipase EstA (alpha/beta hydrolase family)